MTDGIAFTDNRQKRRLYAGRLSAYPLLRRGSRRRHDLGGCVTGDAHVAACDCLVMCTIVGRLVPRPPGMAAGLMSHEGSAEYVAASQAGP